MLPIKSDGWDEADPGCINLHNIEFLEDFGTIEKGKKFKLRSRNPFKFLSELDDLTISDHDFSVSHSDAGFGYGLSRPTPPVNKKRHTSSSIRPLFFYLWFSKKINNSIVYSFWKIIELRMIK